MTNPLLGQIGIVGFNFAPRDWAYCNGQSMAISQNNALFSLLGTLYGGDGRTTFRLPDLRGRVAINSGGGSTGPGLSPYGVGQMSGYEYVTLNVLEMPSHFHTLSGAGTATSVLSGTGTIQASANNDGTNSPAGKYIGTPPPGGGPSAQIFSGTAPTLPMATGGVSVTGTVGVDLTSIANNLVVNPAGANNSHINIQPYLAVNFVIAMQGTYPSRN